MSQGIRPDKVASARKKIERGAYEHAVDPVPIDVTLDKVLAVLTEDGPQGVNLLQAGEEE